jgi:LacI family transcriptional regulator
MDKLREELLALLQESNPPTAFVAHDDHLAARIVVTLQQHNIRIPEDVSLIAPGDTLDYNQPYVPQITTWRLNNELVGQLAGEMILRRLKNDRKEIEVIKVNHRFIERGSCKPR